MDCMLREPQGSLSLLFTDSVLLLSTNLWSKLLNSWRAYAFSWGLLGPNYQSVLSTLELCPWIMRVTATCQAAVFHQVLGRGYFLQDPVEASQQLHWGCFCCPILQEDGWGAQGRGVASSQSHSQARAQSQPAQGPIQSFKKQLKYVLQWGKKSQHIIVFKELINTTNISESRKI